MRGMSGTPEAGTLTQHVMCAAKISRIVHTTGWCVAPRAKLPCASGTHTAQEASAVVVPGTSRAVLVPCCLPVQLVIVRWAVQLSASASAHDEPAHASQAPATAAVAPDRRGVTPSSW